MSRPQHCGFISLLYSIGDKPLRLWSKHVSLNGRIRRVEDQALKGDKVIEIMGPHQTPVPTNITCPANPMDVLNIKLPILVFVIKNLELIFKLEFQLLDKAKHRRKISLTTHNDEKPTLPHPNTVHVPLTLDEGWNNLEINLQHLCHDVYESDYEAIQKIIIYPNCRIRRVYFQDKHYEQDETPVELCQAFFDMYMLKWGIHLVERSCQTEEMYTGPLQPCDLEYFAAESNISVSIMTSLPLYNDTRINQIKQVMGKDIGVSTILYNSKTVVQENNSKSVNPLGKRAAIVSNGEFEISNSKHSSSITNYDVKRSHKIDKGKSKSTNLHQKVKKKSEHRAEKSKRETQIRDKLSRDSQEMYFDLKVEEHMVELLPHIKKSQYLKNQIGRSYLNSNFEIEDRNFCGCLHEYGKNIKSNCKVERQVQGKISEKLKLTDNINSENFNLCLATLNPAYVAMNKEKFVPLKVQNDIITEKLKPAVTTSNNLRKVEIYQGDSLLSHSVRAIEEVINEVQKIREQLNNYDIVGKIPGRVPKDSIKDLQHNVPPAVEIEATLSNKKSRKAILSTDKAVCDYLELRHAINKKILEKLKDKGLTITEVELSIYNSKNRRNCYGQGKLIESGKGCINKASGLSSVEPVRKNISLRKGQLSLNDKICMQLRNELDAALLQLKSNQVRISTEAVKETIENIVNKDSEELDSDFFTGQEAQCIKKKVCNEDMLICDTKTASSIEYEKNTKNQIHDFIQNLDKYSGMEIVNVLFQRQMYDSEAEYRSI